MNFIEKTLNEGLLNLTDWCRVNKLSINIIKSNFMVFKPRQKRENLNIKLEFKQCTILGVIVDENLSWKLHIGYILSKVSKSIDIIYKASLCLPTSTFFTLCYSLVYPYLLHYGMGLHLSIHLETYCSTPDKGGTNYIKKYF